MKLSIKKDDGGKPQERLATIVVPKQEKPLCHEQEKSVTDFPANQRLAAEENQK